MKHYQVVVAYARLNVEDLDVMELVLEQAPDAVVTCVDGRTRVQATMAAHCAQNAVEDLVGAIHRAAPEAEPGEVELQLQSVSEIAAAVGLNREAVRLWSTGRRGPGGFPNPIDVVGGDRTKVWAAHDVWNWLQANGLPCSEARPLSIAETVDGTRAIERLRGQWANRPALVDAAHWRTVRSDETVVPVRGTAPRAFAN
jgi:hypothetical protein